MFEVIGIIVTVYVLVGVVAMLWLYSVDKEMRKTIGYVVERKDWLELTMLLAFSVWCWPWPVLEHLSD